MKLVMIHGRDQQGKDPVELRAIWINSLKIGLLVNNLSLPDDIEIVFPFYGDFLDDLVNQSRLSKNIEGVIARGEIPKEQLAFYHDMLLELTENAAIPQSIIDQNFTGSFKERGPLNWEWVQSLLKSLDQYTSIGNLTLKKFTYDVFVYLTIPGIQRRVNEYVIKEVGNDSFVLLGHSLGSIIGYNILHSGQYDEVYKYITVGSPLGLRSVKSRLKKSPAMPTCVKYGWYNAYDDRDVVALNPLDERYFNISPAIENNNKVTNWTDNRHGIEGYLEDADVALKIYTAILA